MTCHKAQGKTLSKAIIDLQNCCGSEVIVSQVKSLSGLLILHGFDIAHIHSRPSQDLCNEMKHLNELDATTLQAFCSDDYLCNLLPAVTSTNQDLHLSLSSPSPASSHPPTPSYVP
ncbi:hypothetical protein BDQ17DRAFT_1231022 [Cyathus striatus]|nr:hypothetical protein BDQ17DRAFT_1231022 [Cyathus striatus]